MNEPVHRHHWIVRLTHWSAFALIFGMIASGLQIYRAYPRFGERGGPYYPNIFQDLAFPEWTRLGGWLAGGLNWHFFFMWPLIGIGALYLGYLAMSGEWKKLVFRPRDVKPAIEMQKYYLRLKKDHPPPGEAQCTPEGSIHSDRATRSAFDSNRLRHMEAHPVAVARLDVRWLSGRALLALLGSLALRRLHGGTCLTGVRR